MLHCIHLIFWWYRNVKMSDIYIEIIKPHNFSLLYQINSCFWINKNVFHQCNTVYVKATVFWEWNHYHTSKLYTRNIARSIWEGLARFISIKCYQRLHVTYTSADCISVWVKVLGIIAGSIGLIVVCIGLHLLCMCYTY